MESANRVLTRRALDVLKSIATGEYKATEQAKADMVAEGGIPDSEDSTPESEAVNPEPETGEAS
jgi:hypothetical protein